MRKTLATYCLLFILFGTVFVYGHNGNNTCNYASIKLKDGLSQISVLKIFQDSKGFIWFATRNGLNRYDGVHFTVYRHQLNSPASLSDNHIIALAEDGEGNLWIGTTHGLNRLNRHTDEMTAYSARPEYAVFDSGIKCLLCDHTGRMLIGTKQGLYVYADGEFQANNLNGELDDVIVSSLCETNDHRLLIGTTTRGFYSCTPDMKTTAHFSKTNHNLHTDDIPVLYEDSRHRLWTGNSQDGMARIDLSTGQYTVYQKTNSGLSSNSVRCFADDGQTLYIGTSDGICTLPLDQPDAGITAEYNNLSHFSVYSILIDNCGTRWVGTYSGGVNYYNKYGNRFTTHTLPSSGEFSGIYGIMDYDTANRRLYIATEGNGLLEYDPEEDASHSYLIDHSSQQHSQNIIKTVRVKDGRVWCGTNNGSIYIFDIRSKQFTPYYQAGKGSSIYTLLPTGDGSVWMTNSSESQGVMQLKEGKVVRDKFTRAQVPISNARNMLELQPGVFLIGTRYKGLVVYDERKDSLTVYDTDHGLLNNYVTALLPDPQHQVIWVGTFGGGVCQYKAGEGITACYTTADGLGANEVYQIVKDLSGYLWISTTNGVSRFSPTDKEFVNYDRYNGIEIQEFTPHSGTVLPDGMVVLGGNNDFLTFHPLHIEKNMFLPPLVLTGLSINNQPITPGTDSPLAKTIDETQTLELDYRQDNLAISYCALNYIYPLQNQYAFRLQGHDDAWNYVGNRQVAYYTNLAPGNYVFEVKAANNDGVWNPQTRTLRIIVHPPFWKTWYAYLFYIVSFFGICFLILYFAISKKDLEQALAYEHLKQQQAEEFHQTKLRMFTNFSHELRTPLTLIVSPLQELLQRTDFNATVRNKISLIYNNAQRLLLLVNQLMDLRKNQANKMQLKITQDDLNAFIQEIYSAFNQIALSKNIHFHYEGNHERMPAWFDKSVFEKVIFNLLSNAFKYTPAGGSITLSVSKVKPENLPAAPREGWTGCGEEDSLVLLGVSDTGKGIPAKEMENIFTPFYQIEDGRSKDVIGTGIGLSLTHSIVQLHHGLIWVKNNEQGGALFQVAIPISRTAYSEDEIDREAADRVVMDVIPSTTAPEAFHLEKRYTILLAEDHEEVRTYVKECLEPYFNVLEAEDGEQAFDMVVDKYPDLVVSDIMMPRKDGLELCTEIKEDMRTGHIPVILMTARSMVMHIKEGFSSGADDYIVKPFNMDVLIYRIRNILASREKLRSLYGKKFSPEAIGIEKASGDDRFTQRFFEVIEKNISNPELNIDFLSKEIGMSRTNLYRKLKAITDLSPIELIRNKRLEVATKLLLESDYSISEISTYAGFNSHAYFTNCFRAAYGCSPTEFVERQKRKDNATE